MPSTFLSHGNLATPILVSKSISQRGDGLDTGTASYISDEQYPFVIGEVLADLPGMHVDDIRNTYAGDHYQHECNVSGILGGARQLTGYPKIRGSNSDWDGIEDAWLTTNVNYFLQGTLGSYGGRTVCTATSAEPMNSAGTVYKVTGSFQGILTNKTRTRVVQSNGQIINGDSIRAALENGWTNYRKGQVSLPKITVTDTYPSLTPPDTQSVPSRRTPPSPPGVRNLDGLTFRTVDEGNLGATASRDVWPSQWSYTCGYSQPFGLNIALYMVTETYEWNWPVIPA